MNSLREWLKGKKAYLVCLAAILAAVIAWASGDSGTLDTVKMILAALGGITLRAGISKAAAPMQGSAA